MLNKHGFKNYYKSGQTGKKFKKKKKARLHKVTTGSIFFTNGTSDLILKNEEPCVIVESVNIQLHIRSEMRLTVSAVPGDSSICRASLIRESTNKSMVPQSGMLPLQRGVSRR